MYQFEKEEQEKKNRKAAMINRAQWLRLRERQELSAGHDQAAQSYTMEREAISQALMINESLNLFGPSRTETTNRKGRG